jgi:uncharacterized membrane protein (UPF0127 family)
MASRWKHCLAVSLLSLLGTAALAAEIHFDKEKISLAGKIVQVEMAKSAVQHEHGLMLRKKLSENDGMLFVFANEEVRSFWMKNTIIDLSIGYFDKDRLLIDIQEMKATNMLEARPPSYPSAKPAMYALEMNKGWFAKNRIKLGQKFDFFKR